VYKGHRDPTAFTLWREQHAAVALSFAPARQTLAAARLCPTPSRAQMRSIESTRRGTQAGPGLICVHIESMRTVRCCGNKWQLRLHISCQKLAKPDDGNPGVHDLADQLRSTERTLGMAMLVP